MAVLKVSLRVCHIVDSILEVSECATGGPVRVVRHALDIEGAHGEAP